MRITIREKSIVKPAQETPNCIVWSSNIDLLVARYHMRTIYLYRRPMGTASNFIDSEVLKEALSRVLVPFYPIAGRMGKDKDGRLEIDCNGKGVLFVVAETESKLDDFGDFKPTPEMKGLIPTLEYTENDISDYPLLVVQASPSSYEEVLKGVFGYIDHLFEMVWHRKLLYKAIVMWMFLPLMPALLNSFARISKTQWHLFRVSGSKKPAEDGQLIFLSAEMKGWF